jgi:hypothetical protein
VLYIFCLWKAKEDKIDLPTGLDVPEATKALDLVGGLDKIQAAFPRERDPILIVQEADLTPKQVWTIAEKFAITGLTSPDGQGCRNSLYWLSYPEYALLAQIVSYEWVMINPCPNQEGNKLQRANSEFIQRTPHEDQ